jgi:hypothetical protein
MQMPENGEDEPFKSFTPGLPADLQCFFQAVRGLVELALT